VFVYCSESVQKMCILTTRIWSSRLDVGWAWRAGYY